jgi:hypothetical protein
MVLKHELDDVFDRRKLIGHGVSCFFAMNDSEEIPREVTLGLLGTRRQSSLVVTEYAICTLWLQV